jgi:hypothetical protein
MRVLLATILVALASTSAFAQGNGNNGSTQSGGGITALETRVAALEAQNIALQATVSQLLTDLAAVGPHVAAYSDAQAIAAVDPTDVLELLWRGYGSDINEVYLEGANLHVNNGLGDTATTNSLGNVIIGYNEPRGRGVIDRSGSHMLVLGRGNNYLSYGGILAGTENTTSGPYSSVSGGVFNEASGEYSSVSGGMSNDASGEYSSVRGGRRNEASGESSSVSGGYSNVAIGNRSSVSGGYSNVAIGNYSSVSGGSQNEASGGGSSVSGGYSNVASGDLSSVSGGRQNEASGMYSSVSGGSGNVASGYTDVAP